MERSMPSRGATQLRFLDVLITLILLGVLIFAADMLFKTYHQPTATPSPAAVASKAASS